MRCFLFALAVALVGCGGSGIRVDYDPAARFDGLRTFDIMPGGSGLDDDRLDVQKVETVIASAIVVQIPTVPMRGAITSPHDVWDVKSPQCNHSVHCR